MLKPDETDKSKSLFSIQVVCGNSKLHEIILERKSFSEISVVFNPCLEAPKLALRFIDTPPSCYKKVQQAIDDLRGDDLTPKSSNNELAHRMERFIMSSIAEAQCIKTSKQVLDQRRNPEGIQAAISVIRSIETDHARKAIDRLYRSKSKLVREAAMHIPF